MQRTPDKPDSDGDVHNSEEKSSRHARSLLTHCCLCVCFYLYLGCALSDLISDTFQLLDSPHPQWHKVRQHLGYLSPDSGRAPESKWGRITGGRAERGPRSSALTLNYWVGLAEATCSTITTLPARAHRHSSQAGGEELKTLHSLQRHTCIVLLWCVYLEGSFALGWRGFGKLKEEKRDMPCWQLSYPSIPSRWDEFAEWFKTFEINIILNKFSLWEVANGLRD